jgi:hypothetical protein
VIELYALFRTDKKKTRYVKSKVKSMLTIFFDIKGIAHKEFILAGQTVNSASYGNVLQQLYENVRRLHTFLPGISN